MSMSLRSKRNIDYVDRSIKKIKTAETSTIEDCSGINCLPDCILLNIFSRLKFHEICICSSVCHKWRRVANDSSLKKIIIINKPLQKKHLRSFVNCHVRENLEELRFEKCDMDGRCGKMLFSALSKRCNNMEKLDLCVDKMPAEVLRYNNIPTTVSHLGIRMTVYEDSNERIIRCPRWADNLSWPTQLYSTMRHLTCLVLSNSDTAFYGTSFFQLKFLKALYLESCYMFDDSCIKNMRILSQLEILDIEGTGVTNEGVQIIFETCVNIRELFIGHLYINDEVLKRRYKRNLPHLQVICMRRTHISLNRLQYFLCTCSRRSGRKVEPDDQCIFCKDPFELRKYLFPLSRCSHHLLHKCPKK